MTYSINSNDIQEVINANNVSHFSITKSKGAFLSFDISPLSEDKAEKIVLSLFLEDKNNAGDVSEFLIYPVGASSKKIGDMGLAIKTKTQKEDFVDFVLPTDLFTTEESLFGVVVFTNQDNTFWFRGTDGTVNGPRLTVVHGQANIAENFFDLSQGFKDELRNKLERINEYAKTAATNSERRWYEKPYVTIPLALLLGFFAGLAANFIFKKYF